MSGLFDGIEKAVAAAVVDAIEHVDEATCLGFVVDVRVGDKRVRLGSGTVQNDLTALEVPQEVGMPWGDEVTS